MRAFPRQQINVDATILQSSAYVTRPGCAMSVKSSEGDCLLLMLLWKDLYSGRSILRVHFEHCPAGQGSSLRFDKHKAGIQANRFVFDYGLRLLPVSYKVCNA